MTRSVGVCLCIRNTALARWGRRRWICCRCSYLILAVSFQVPIIGCGNQLVPPEIIVQLETGTSGCQSVAKLMVQGYMLHSLPPTSPSIVRIKSLVAKTATVGRGRTDIAKVLQAVRNPIIPARKCHEAAQEIKRALEDTLGLQRRNRQHMSGSDIQNVTRCCPPRTHGRRNRFGCRSSRCQGESNKIQARASASMVAPRYHHRSPVIISRRTMIALIPIQATAWKRRLWSQVLMDPIWPVLEVCFQGGAWVRVPRARHYRYQYETKIGNPSLTCEALS